MADLKISELTNLTAADPANDMIPIVDVSATPPASGSTKRISINNILACSPTATLASATITGDLTVDTSTLKVDSVNNRVGIGTATPSAALDVNGASNLNGNVTIANTGSPFGTLFVTGSALELQANSNATNGLSLKTTSTTPIIFSVNSSEAMRLNSTGLGLGGIAAGLERFVVFSGASKMMSIDTNGTFFADGGTGKGRVTIENSSATNSILSTTTLFGAYNILKTAASQHQWFLGGSTQAMTLDASGNLLVGTTTSLANTSHSFQATGTTNSFWAGTFQHNGTANNGRVLNWKLANANDTGSYFVFANNSGGNCFNVLGNGNVQNTTGTYGTISDLRLKENISDARNYLADLLKLRVVKYSLKSESSPTANLIGLIAQEVEQVFPTLVETNGDDVKSIKTTVLIPMLLKALQELTARVQTLETR